MSFSGNVSPTFKTKNSFIRRSTFLKKDLIQIDLVIRLKQFLDDYDGGINELM